MRLYTDFTASNTMIVTYVTLSVMNTHGEGSGIAKRYMNYDSGFYFYLLLFSLKVSYSNIF